MTGRFSVLLVLLLASSANSLFEDQAFKFDWHLQQVGVPRGARLWETAQGEQALVVRTEQGALASVDSDTGDIRWRHVGEDGEEILDLSVNERTVATVSYLPFSSKLTATPPTDEDDEPEPPHYTLALRLWSPLSGALNNELLVTVPIDVEGDDSGAPHPATFILGTDANVVTYNKKTGVMTIRVFDLKKSSTGEELRSAKLALPPAVKEPQCANTRSALLCLDPETNTLYHAALPLPEDGNGPKPSFAAVSLSSLGLPEGAVPLSVSAVTGSKNLAAVAHAGGVLTVASEGGRLKSSNAVGAAAAVAGCKNTDGTLHVKQRGSEFEVSLVDAAGKSSSKSAKVKLPLPAAELRAAWGVCDEEGSTAKFRIFMLTEDGTLFAADSEGSKKDKANPLLWTREEALSAITAVEMLNPVEDYELEEDFDEDAAPEGFEAKDILEQFLRRIRRHASQIALLLHRLLETRDPLQLIIGAPDLSYEDFGLRKTVVAVSAGLGAVSGVDSKTGQVLWKLVYPGRQEEGTKLFLQRGSGHFGLDPRCTLVYLNSATGKWELLVFNPSNGVAEGKARELGADFTQAVMIHHMIEDHIKPVLLLHGQKGAVTSEPAVAVSHLGDDVVDKTYFATLDKDAGVIRGQKLVKKGDKFGLLPTWSLSSPNAEVLLVSSKRPEETVHSQGRVMADRSVLFKYVNPNLALVLAEGRDSSGKAFLNVYLSDLVTGRVVFSATHKRVSGPYRAVHSENWAVYTYYNDKSRRGELVSVELFEGAAQSNATVFSSLGGGSTLNPMVERQAFILGGNSAHVAGLKDTVTEQGITSKTVLLATTTGLIYTIPRVLLDPRRPNLNTPPEKREPGLPPYVPELGLPQEMILNYNQTIANPRGMATAPTFLESTSVVFIYGLDIYCTRISPSKGFDLLKDDFDYYVISLVLLALVAAAVFTRKLSQLKNLKQAWK